MALSAQPVQKQDPGFHIHRLSADDMFTGSLESKFLTEHAWTNSVEDLKRKSLKIGKPILPFEQSSPDYFDNLTSLFESRSRIHAEKSYVFYTPGKLQAPPTTVSYATFFHRVQKVASQLLQEDVVPGSIILIHLDNHYENLLYWWAVVYAGFVPTMSTPLSNNMDQRRAHLIHLYSLLDNPLVLTRERLSSDFSVQSALRLRPIESLQPAHPEKYMNRDGLFYPVNQGFFKMPKDVAALMLTSGSTGYSKAVCLTHGLILKSIAGKAAINGNDHQTSFFNWIGADHVACLTEMHAHAVWVGGDQVYAEATDVILDPLSFWRICHKHRISHSFAPNFFLASLTRALTSVDGIKLRKSMGRLSLRAIVTGGEANVVDTCLALTQILEEAGAPLNCLKPTFGMTETCGGAIYSHLFPSHDVTQGYNFASVGKPIDGLNMRIVDEDGDEIAPGSGLTGLLQVSGPVVFNDYYNDLEATKKSFQNGWFSTGDRGMIDTAGQLSLTGRAKELLIINGVNHSPSSIEAILEGIEGTVASYTLVLPYRARDADTESLCVVYLPTYQMSDAQSRDATNNTISTAVLLQIGIRPLIIPLDKTVLQKSTLGKLPRNKIIKALEAGTLDSYARTNQEQIAAYQKSAYEAPASAMERLIIDTFLEVLQLVDLQLGATTNLFAIGINSIDLITIKQKLQSKLGGCKIPTAIIISNPTPRELAASLESLNATQSEYNPMVTLHAGGSKTPLWLIHPGVGEVLVFLALAYHIRDRPVYAMRARGFEAGEAYFASTDDAVQTYYRKIRHVQPRGPYALVGYSFGSMVAFEVAKLLRQTDEVRLLGVLNLPPHIKARMRQLDWHNCLLHLSYFLNLISEEHAHAMHPVLREGSRDAALGHVFELAPPDRLGQLGLDSAGLRNWADLAYSLQSSAVDYEPSGTVDCMDVFYAIPLNEVARDMDDWVNNHLAKWRDFCVEQPRFHRVDGAHYTMISPAHVHTFQKVLKKVLEERNL